MLHHPEGHWVTNQKSYKMLLRHQGWGAFEAVEEKDVSIVSSDAYPVLVGLIHQAPSDVWVRESVPL